MYDQVRNVMGAWVDRARQGGCWDTERKHKHTPQASTFCAKEGWHAVGHATWSTTQARTPETKAEPNHTPSIIQSAQE